MNVAHQTFDHRNFYGKPNQPPADNHLEMSAYNTDKNRALGLNHFLDAVALENSSRPKIEDLSHYKVTSSEDFLTNVDVYLTRNLERIISGKDPIVRDDGSLSDQQRRENSYNQQAFNNALKSYIAHLVDLRAKIERMPLLGAIKVVPDNGGEAIHVPDEHISTNVKYEAARIIEDKIRTVSRLAHLTDAHRDELIKVASGKNEPQPQPGVSNITGAQNPVSNKWSKTKILGVSTLGVSGLALLGLAGYVYEADKKPKALIQSQRAQASFAQAPQMGGTYAAPGILGTPQPSPAALGFNPAAGSANAAGSSPSFNPGPLYGYPS